MSFSGASSVLRADFLPEIALDPNENYSCALLDFTTYNSIPNITKGINSKFEFKYTPKGKSSAEKKTIHFDTGAYEVNSILNYLKTQLANIHITLTFEVNAATSKVKIIFDAKIQCIDHSVLKLLGFTDKQKTFEANTPYWNKNIVKITNIDVIRIDCDLVSNSYINGKSCHTIHEFTHLKVETGYKLHIIPQHIIYLPINQKTIRTIQISVVDQSGKLIDFRGEQITCRIHIKKDN